MEGSSSPGNIVNLPQLLTFLGLERWCVDSTAGTKTTAQAGYPRSDCQKCPPASAPLWGGGGRKAGRGSVKRGTKQGEERAPSHEPQQGRKGLSTPISTDTTGGVQSHRPDPRDTEGHCFPASVSYLCIWAPHTQLCTGAGSLQGQGPSSDWEAEGEALRGDSQSCPLVWGGARGRSQRSPPAGFLRVSRTPDQSRPGGQALICTGPASSSHCARGKREETGRWGRGEGGPAPPSRSLFL